MIEVPPRTPESVPVVNATDYHAFTQAWRLVPNKDSQIVIVKASFRLTPNAPAEPLPAEEQVLPEGELPFDESPTEAPRYPGDLAFFKPKADVILTGHAYASNRETVRRVELRLGRSLSFTLAAIGDRVWGATGASPPAPFERIPLRPELAFGGPGFDANPVGRGFRASTGSALPNLERIGSFVSSMGDRPKPAFTTPIAITWKERASKTGTYRGDWVTKRAPYFPDDFDWSYFNAAPRELQIEYPRGDESYALAGVRPKGENLAGTLPGLRMRVLAQPKADPRQLIELPMKIDTVVFEPDELRVLLVWRGAIASKDAYGSDLASFFVCAEPLGSPMPEGAVRALFEETLQRQYGPPEPEVVEPEEVDVAPPMALPPDAPRAMPRGITPRMARLLQLPGWMVTIDEPDVVPPAPMPEPPPPQASMSKSELDALVAGGGSLAGLDLENCDLTGADLRERDLTGAHLMHAKLDGAKLDGASMEGAVMTDASANGASFAGARLDGAILSGAKLEACNFAGASLQQATLTGIKAARARFQGAVLVEAIIAEAFLFGANFDGADLTAADLSAAFLEEASFLAAKLNDARLYDAKARGIVADDAEMGTLRADGAILHGASLQRVKGVSASIRSADLREANLTQADFSESIFVGSLFDAAILSQLEAKEARFKHASLVGTSLIKANLMNADFEGANLSRADLRGANLYDAGMFNATLTGAKMEHAIRTS